MINSNQDEEPIVGRLRVRDYKALVPENRPRSKFHPKDTTRWMYDGKAHRLETNRVTVDSDAVVFAWEFLRRNKYYMALVDKRIRYVPASLWGYQWDKQVERTHGLLELKPYTEHFHEGKHPSWIGLDSFAQALMQQKVSTAPQNIQLSLQPGQIAIVIDLGNHFHASPWRQQIFALQDYLQDLAKSTVKTKEVKGKSQHKKVLLRRLRILDMFSRGESAVKAGQLADNMQAQDEIERKSKRARLPINAGLPSSKTTKPTSYEDLDEAYQLVYRHGYLKLVAQDTLYKIDGDRMRPYTYKEIMGEEEKVSISLKNIKGIVHRIE